MTQGKKKERYLIRQYNIQIDIIIFFKCKTKQIKATEISK